MSEKSKEGSDLNYEQKIYSVWLKTKDNVNEGELEAVVKIAQEREASKRKADEMEK